MAERQRNMNVEMAAEKFLDRLPNFFEMKFGEEIDRSFE
jgi:hypothetical protein